MTKAEKRLLIGLIGVGILGVIASAVIAGGLLLSVIRGGAPLITRAPAADGPVQTALQNVIAKVETKQPSQDAQAMLNAPTVVREALPLAVSQAADQTDLTRLYEQTEPGVVSIEVRLTVASPFGGGQFYEQGSGSGFVFDDNHIVTNNHVVSSAQTVEVVFYDGQRREGRVLATDKFSDLAVVEVSDMPSSARALPLVRDFKSLAVGQPVVAIGNPFGNANTMTYGIVSALGRVIPSGTTQYSIPQAIQTDAAINPGNSGGPLMDLRGQVIGVNAQINTTNQGTSGVPGNSGVGFAIPSSIVARVIPKLIADGQYDWPYLGVTGTGDISLEMAKANNLSDTRGAYITSVVAGGPSDGSLQAATNLPSAQVQQQGTEGGIQVIPFGQQNTQTDVVPVGGDVVIAVDGLTVRSFDDLLTYVALEGVPGQTVELTVLRGGQQVKVPVTLGTRPAPTTTDSSQP